MVEFGQQPNAHAGHAFFHQWYLSVMRSRLTQMKKAAKSLKAHLSGLLTYFTHRITNALTEGFNSKIQAIKADAWGLPSLRKPPHRNSLDLCDNLQNLATEANGSV